MLGHHKWNQNGNESGHCFTELNEIEIEIANLGVKSYVKINNLDLLCHVCPVILKVAKNNMAKIIFRWPCLYFLYSVLNGYGKYWESVE